MQRLSHYYQELAKPVHGSIDNEPWYLEELKKEEVSRCSRLMISYNPPKIFIDTYEVKRYIIDGGEPFMHVKKLQREVLPASNMNLLGIKNKVREEMDKDDLVQRMT